MLLILEQSRQQDTIMFRAETLLQPVRALASREEPHVVVAEQLKTLARSSLHWVIAIAGAVVRVLVQDAVHQPQSTAIVLLARLLQLVLHKVMICMCVRIVVRPIKQTTLQKYLTAILLQELM